MLDYHCRNNIPLTAYDSDKRNPDLSRFYGKLAPVQLIDLSSITAFDSVLDQLAADPSSRAMIDLAAGAGDSLHQLISGDVRLAGALEDLGARATVVYVISRSRPSVAGLSVALKDFAAVPADWIVVKNLYHGAAEKFVRYDGSNARNDALARGAREVTMPELLDDLYDALDQASTPLSAAAEDGALSFTNRRRIRAFIERFDEELAKVAEVL
ncbi:MAG: hypothetical protein Q7R40_15330 [Phaeospirillum sp.]|nr:hypothetical protein [Phaeospirillum sp.]